MRPLLFLRRNPHLILIAFAVMFVGWVCWDAVTPSQLPEAVLVLPSGGPNRAFPTIVDESVPEPPRLTPEGTAHAIPKLKTGMTRTEVEGLVGAPGPGNVSPATTADGRVFYRTWYEADFTPPATVRPIARSHVGKLRTVQPIGVPPSRVTLEFDATKPGHPLVGVYYPDPLF